MVDHDTDNRDYDEFKFHTINNSDSRTEVTIIKIKVPGKEKTTGKSRSKSILPLQI